MRKLLLVVAVLISVSIYSENRVSISTKSDKVVATINLNESEYITLNEDFLFLFVESDEYNFVFSGYPEGVVQENGDVLYADQLVLEGMLTLKDGVEPGNYTVEVILGFQTCDKEGICNIPVELSEEIVVKQASSRSIIPVIIGLILIIFIVIIAIIKRKSLE